MKTYLLLGISILFEVAGATAMKYSEGFTNVMASLVVIFCYTLAVSFYIFITKNNEIGMINALWSGGGTLLVTLLGVGLFGESVTMSKLLGLTLILVGMVGLTVPVKERSV
ncbi:SMR family transporter [Halobacillus litoralis]|uniref:DMT family transporter n=1 Tax=Halobacillus litoralis TaxID=45668 RepID=UPI00273DD46D|nr:SMR family transporter [Halobacillus litoralis]WLR47378.1 SMR family transporter [Halobacillus litoralis]